MTARSGTTFGKGNLFMIQKIYYTFFFFLLHPSERNSLKMFKNQVTMLWWKLKYAVLGTQKRFFLKLHFVQSLNSLVQHFLVFVLYFNQNSSSDPELSGISFVIS